MNSIQVAGRYLDTLARADFDNWSKLLALDAIMLFPYSPPGFPTRYEGRAECEAATRGIFSAIENFEFYDVELQQGKDPEVVFGTARSRAVTRAGKPYGNEYVLLFRIRDEQIFHYREYFNPLPIIEAFGPSPGRPES